MVYGPLAFELSLPELVTFVLVLVGCLVWAPFVVRHWRGTYDRIELGLEHLPFTLAQRTKDRMMATYHFVVIAVGSMAAGVLLDAARPRVVSAVPELLGLVFFACLVLFVTVWFWGKPARMVPPRYRRKR